MRISLIVTVLNEKRSIERFLESVASQSKIPDELVIVDAGSIDGTIETIQSYESRLNGLKVIVEESASRGRGRNLAIEHSIGDIVAVTDAGCVAERDWLANMVKPIAEGSCDVSVGSYRSSHSNSFEFFEGYLLVPSDLRKTSRISSRSLAFRREVWEAGCRYDENVNVGEDTQFHLCFMQHGYRVCYADDAFLYWEMPRNFRELWRKLCAYGDGYWQTLLVKGFRSFFFVIMAFYILVGLSLLLVCIGEIMLFVGLLLLGMAPILALTAIGVARSRHMNGFLYLPLLMLVQNTAFVTGFTFAKLVGLIRTR